MYLLFDLLPVFHHLALDDAFDAEPGAERAAAFLHRQTGVVEDRRAGMLELRRAPAWPRQTVILATDFRIILRRPHGDHIELGLVLHVSLEPFGRLPAIARRPPAAIDLAQDVFGRHLVVLDLDVLEHPIGKAELAGEQVYRVVVVFGFENRIYDLLAPLQRAVRSGARTIHLEARAGWQEVRAVLALRD